MHPTMVDTRGCENTIKQQRTIKYAFILSFSKQLLSACYAPGTVLGTWNTWGTRKTVPCPQGDYNPWGKTKKTTEFKNMKEKKKKRI